MVADVNFNVSANLIADLTFFKLKKLYRLHTAHPQLKLCINKFEDLLGRIESALEKEQTSKLQRPCEVEQVFLFIKSVFSY